MNSALPSWRGPEQVVAETVPICHKDLFGNQGRGGRGGRGISWVEMGLQPITSFDQVSQLPARRAERTDSSSEGSLKRVKYARTSESTLKPMQRTEKELYQYEQDNKCEQDEKEMEQLGRASVEWNWSIDCNAYLRRNYISMSETTSVNEMRKRWNSWGEQVWNGIGEEKRTTGV
ncbi:uncharacterized protein MELLADRAFT_109516 [Melampsora larici-populina 98AG31]|uniref:Uncharacterized protein n=1 Tax=Melampsora larici-populina (strain 98AG31 / pathotype 3-4-7) TaxID=747676 RepID=F4RWQ9_MELLP|nr:uncharacterized protein MELLADRAFT_109516 [Melampsora larici-populina 98AG31]EGG03186.1 hypothetical protein MELLADRAFT_109516 [Melampsora larici-populina 98AG31]